jgi:hypothetical protein
MPRTVRSTTRARVALGHQSLALLARQLEAAGIATVILAAACDIVEHVGVPRRLCSDLPLGHAAGWPYDPASQDLTLEPGLRLLESAGCARTTVRNSLRWPGGDGWRDDYLNPAALDEASAAAARRAHGQSLATARSLRQP